MQRSEHQMTNLAESSKKCYGSKRAVLLLLLMMMVMMTILDLTGSFSSKAISSVFIGEILKLYSFAI
jgi:hypothetical protein